MFLFRPVMAGVWKQRETFDGTYTFEDLLDAHEILDIKAENENRLEAFSKSKQGME